MSTTPEPEPEEGTTPEPEPEPDTPAEPEPDTPGDQSLAQAAAAEGSEEQLKRAETANRNYHKRIREILGDDPNRHECPACEGLGVVWGEQQEEYDFATAKDAEPCTDCNALGMVLTGSRNPDQRLKPCTPCGGRGWLVKPVPVAPVVALPVTPEAAATPVGGQWVPGVGFIPYGQTAPTIPDAGGAS